MPPAVEAELVLVGGRTSCPSELEGPRSAPLSHPAPLWAVGRDPPLARWRRTVVRTEERQHSQQPTGLAVLRVPGVAGSPRVP